MTSSGGPVKRTLTMAGAAAIVFASLSANGQIQAVQGSVETARIQVAPGHPVRVRALGCAECPRDFIVERNAEFYVGNDRIPREALPDYDGRVGTVTYDLESERAVELRWIPVAE